MFLYEYITNLIHISLGFISARYSQFGLFIAAAFTAYEYVTSKTKAELYTDYLEFIIGLIIGLSWW
jgi:hypothetical protein